MAKKNLNLMVKIGILIGKVKDAAGVKGDVDPKNESVSNFLKSNKSAKEFFKL